MRFCRKGEDGETLICYGAEEPHLAQTWDVIDTKLNRLWQELCSVMEEDGQGSN